MIALLLVTAYYLALLLWIPLGFLAAKRPSMRRRVMLPLVASAVGAVYQAVMTLFWAYGGADPLRRDVFLVMLALSIVDAFAGLILVPSKGSQGPDREPSLIAGILCLSVPALAITGFAAWKLDSASFQHNVDLARQFSFEASFRDDVTEKRFFGDLKPDKNPWAGFYVYVGGADEDRFKYLVINDEGRFWIYHSTLSVRQGRGGQSSGSPDTFEGSGERMHMALRRQESGPFLLKVHYDGIPASPTPRAAPMKKADPPRFSRPASARDEVRFVGEFSATFGERNGGFWLIQVWLWESEGDWWGQYIHDRYRRGEAREFVSTEKIWPDCSEQCKVLSFGTSRGPQTLLRVSADELKAVGGSYPHKEVTLKRGEALPGFIFDLVPLATKKENLEVIRALTTAGMITWDVPPAGQ